MQSNEACLHCLLVPAFPLCLHPSALSSVTVTSVRPSTVSLSSPIFIFLQHFLFFWGFSHSSFGLCVCVCVCVRALCVHTQMHTHTNAYTELGTHTELGNMCVCPECSWEQLKDLGMPNSRHASSTAWKHQPEYTKQNSKNELFVFKWFFGNSSRNPFSCCLSRS